MEDLVRVVVLGTGHSAMWAATLGRWKPTNACDGTALVVGIFLWLTAAACVWLGCFA